jgi:hypothetical protein
VLAEIAGYACRAADSAASGRRNTETDGASDAVAVGRKTEARASHRITVSPPENSLTLERQRGPKRAAHGRSPAQFADCWHMPEYFVSSLGQITSRRDADYTSGPICGMAKRTRTPPAPPA